MLETPEADFGRWETSPPRDGVRSLPWFTFGPAGKAWRAAAGGWIIGGFDWRTWLGDGAGRAFAEDPAAVDTASIDDLARLITAIVRSERFTEGSIEGAFQSGLLARISRRARILLATSTDGTGAEAATDER